MRHLLVSAFSGCMILALAGNSQANATATDFCNLVEQQALSDPATTTIGSIWMERDNDGVFHVLPDEPCLNELAAYLTELNIPSVVRSATVEFHLSTIQYLQMSSGPGIATGNSVPLRGLAGDRVLHEDGTPWMSAGREEGWLEQYRRIFDFLDREGSFPRVLAAHQHGRSARLVDVEILLQDENGDSRWFPISISYYELPKADAKISFANVDAGNHYWLAVLSNCDGAPYVTLAGGGRNPRYPENGLQMRRFWDFDREGISNGNDRHYSRPLPLLGVKYNNREIVGVGSRFSRVIAEPNVTVEERVDGSYLFVELPQFIEGWLIPSYIEASCTDDRNTMHITMRRGALIEEYDVHVNLVRESSE
jgi:hypothetical protein